MAEGIDILQIPSDIKETVERSGMMIDENSDRLAQLEGIEQWQGPFVNQIWAELKKLRDKQDKEVPVVGDNAVAAVDDQLGTENLDGGGSSLTRFELEYTDTLTVTVKAGDFTVNGTSNFPKSDTAIAGEGTDDAGDPYSATFTEDGTHYVYFKLDGATVDPTIAPNKLLIACETARPTDTIMRQQYILIGEFSVSSGVVDEASVIRYRIKDHDYINIVPDGKLSPALSPSIKTTDFREDSLGELMMFDADNANLAGAQTWAGHHGIPRLTKSGAGAGELDWFGWDVDHYGAGKGSLGLSAAGLFEIAGFYVGTVVNGLDYNDFTGGTDDNYTLVARHGAAGGEASTEYITLFDFTARYAEDVLNLKDHVLEQHTDFKIAGAGKALGYVSTAVSDGVGGYVWEWVDPASFDLSDNYWANTTVTGQGDPDDHDYETTGHCCATAFSVQDSTNNSWTKDDFRVEAINSITLITDGPVDVQGSSINLQPIGELQINSVAGSTIANWFSKGILTGTIVEKTWGDLDPTDKILVRV